MCSRSGSEDCLAEDMVMVGRHEVKRTHPGHPEVVTADSCFDSMDRKILVTHAVKSFVSGQWYGATSHGT